MSKPACSKGIVRYHVRLRRRVGDAQREEVTLIHSWMAMLRAQVEGRAVDAIVSFEHRPVRPHVEDAQPLARVPAYGRLSCQKGTQCDVFFG